MPIFQLSDELAFPDPRRAIAEGLLAVGGDLSPARLVLAYQLGIFPWYGEGEPVMWWSPDPRCVLFPPELHVSKRLARIIRQGRFQLTCNRAFVPVVKECAAVRLENGEETWLVAEMQSAYCRLHELGYAHSVEAWSEGKLVGGLYGVALNRFFFGESMFHRQSQASKVIMAGFCRYLAQKDFEFLDCQVPNAHLDSMGSRNISREDFLARLNAGGLGPGGDIRKVRLPQVL